MHLKRFYSIGYRSIRFAEFVFFFFFRPKCDRIDQRAYNHVNTQLKWNMHKWHLMLRVLLKKKKKQKNYRHLTFLVTINSSIISVGADFVANADLSVSLLVAQQIVYGMDQVCALARSLQNSLHCIRLM